MVCEYCGERFSGRPIKQGDQNFCSIECANFAAEIGTEEDGYYEEDTLDMDTIDEEEVY